MKYTQTLREKKRSVSLQKMATDKGFKSLQEMLDDALSRVEEKDGKFVMKEREKKDE